MEQYNPIVNPTSLAQLDKVPLHLTLQGIDWMDRGREADAQNYQDLPGLLSHQQRMRPLDFQRKQLENEMSLAQLPGLRAQSAMQDRKNKMEEITFDDEVSAKLSKLSTQMKEDDIKKIEYEGQKLLTSFNPDERWRGAQLLAATKHMFEESQKQYRNIELEGIKHRNAKELRQMDIDAGKYVKTPRAGKSPEEILASMGYEKASVYYDAKAEAAEDAGNTELANKFREQADKMKQAYERAKAIQAQAAAGGKIDAGAVTGLPTTPAVTPQGFGTTSAQVDARVRVIGPDGRVGTIPSAQLQDALKSGYKEAK